MSRIFDGHGRDFEKGHRGSTPMQPAFARYADLLADRPEDRALAKAQPVPVAFLDDVGA